LKTDINTSENISRVLSNDNNVDKNNANYFPLFVENRKKVIIFAVPSVKRRI
jgi:hypothetical protein